MTTSVAALGVAVTLQKASTTRASGPQATTSGAAREVAVPHMKASMHEWATGERVGNRRPLRLLTKGSHGTHIENINPV